jgi:hypothetical protein
MSAQPSWDQSRHASRPVAVPRGDAEAASDRMAVRILTVAAFASIAAGAIHIEAARTLGRGDSQTFAFFAAVAAAEIVWGLVALVRAPRVWLVLGALGNAAVVTTWLVSRTVGLPVGEFAHEVLPVGYADVLATILGVVTIVGAATLAIRGSSPTRALASARGFALVAAIAIGLLALSGVMSQADAFSGSGGGSGTNAPAGGAYGGYGNGGSNGYGGGAYGGTGGSTGGTGTTTSNGGGY